MSLSLVGLEAYTRRKVINFYFYSATEERDMPTGFKRLFVIAAAAALGAVVVGDTVRAQNPPARGMRWTKAAPFPEPEEELYASVVSGKLYVVGGF